MSNRTRGEATLGLWAMVAAGMLLATPPSGRGQPPEGWDCDFCPAPASWSRRELELGLGHAGDDLRFLPGPGGPTRADEAGPLAWLGGELRHDQADGQQLRLRADRLGLDNPWLQLSERLPGRHQLSASWQELLGRPRPAGLTPFRAAGDSPLTLPADWVTGGSTAQLDTLAGSLRRHAPAQQRHWLNLAADFTAASRWHTRLDYRRQEHRGSDWNSAAFLTQAAWLPDAVDTTTDRLDLAADYGGDTWLASLGYGLSLFRNDAPTLRWDNPYSPLAAGATSGELARAPDNQAHQLSLAGHYHGYPGLNLSGVFSVGRMLQDATLLPASANPELAVALPRPSARARIDTLAGQLRAGYRASRRLRLELRYRHQDRDNRTPAQDFVQVRTDSFIAGSRRNLPYSFRHDQLALQADYRPAPAWRLRLGLEQDRRRRAHQARRRSDESRAWSELRLTGPLQLSARVGYAERTGSTFEAPEQSSPQDSRQRAFNLADRQRWDTRLRLDIGAGGPLRLGLQAELADEDYAGSAVGLAAAHHVSLNAQLSGGEAETLLWQLHAHRAEARLEQAGHQALALTDWWAESRDLYGGYGLSLQRQGLWPRVDVELAYVFSRSDGRIQVNADGFPELATRLHGLTLDGIWHWRPHIDWRLRYRYERYRDADWQYDDLAPDAIGNLLGHGARGHNDVAHLIALSAQWRF